MIRMSATAIAFGVTTLAALPATAATWADHVQLCAEAVSNEGIAPTNEYRAEFIHGSGASAKRVEIELIPHNGGDVLIAECKIKRGEVTEVSVEA